MDYSIPLQRLMLEAELQKMIKRNAPESALRNIQNEIEKLATLQQIEMINYAASHKKVEKKAS